MAQRFKSVYFSDLGGSGQALTLAFGNKDALVYDHVQRLSSQEIRERIGQVSHRALVAAADAENLSVNAYCVRELRQVHARYEANSSLELFPSLDARRHPAFNPLEATFRGGQTEPLHDWFPYLEGYSPGFVARALQEFAPAAKRILDPFAGTGTTPLTVSKIGCTAFYCELNPLLQFLISVKVDVLRLPPLQRRSLAQSLAEIARDVLPFLDCDPDEELEGTYRSVFGGTQFFDPLTFRQVLQARSAIDRLGCTLPDLSKLVLVGVLASLIPSSTAIRRGDLRFKTLDERNRTSASFCENIRGQLEKMALDLERIESVFYIPTLVTEDARHLSRISPLNVDVLLTSPPYLNGTNYFRNTKVELWFLRSLRTQEDLADFRLRAVTAGINDVTNGKVQRGVPAQAQGVVERLSRDAYDPRIPKMVGAYFLEMQHIFHAARKHLVQKGVLLLDIGDSAYGSVHVPTDKILLGVLEDLGFRLRREILMRKRMSRSGVTLKQVLLVLDLPKAISASQYLRPSNARPWLKPWQYFKKTLPHQRGDFAKRNWGNALHSLCSYQGKMKPSLAYHLVKTFVPLNGKVLDPFGGVGTIPFEAALSGRKSWCFEISPAAFHIAAAKLGPATSKDCEQLLAQLESFVAREKATTQELEAASEIRFNGLLSEYFAGQTFQEILVARRFFMGRAVRTPAEHLVIACLLHILHGNRPYALSRRSHPITPFAPTGPFQYRPLMPRLREKVGRSLEAERGGLFVSGTCYFQDATEWWPREVRDLDAVITSPPFFDSTRFHMGNWMRLWFCGWDSSHFKSKPLWFVDERQKRGFSVYESIFRQARERLKPGGVFVMHLGRSRKCDMLAEMAKVGKRWFDLVDSFIEDVDHCESHGIRDKGTVSEHQFLLLQ